MMVAVLLLVALCAVLHTTVAFIAPFRGVQRLSTSRNLFGSEPPKSTPAKQDDKGGMFGGMGNIMESMKKAQEIAKQAEVVNKELMETKVTGKDPSGQVEATFNGLGMPLDLKVADALCSKGGEAVSQACTQAMLDAHTRAQAAMVQRMQALYGVMGPGSK